MSDKSFIESREELMRLIAKRNEEIALKKLNRAVYCSSPGQAVRRNIGNISEHVSKIAYAEYYLSFVEHSHHRSEIEKSYGQIRLYNDLIFEYVQEIVCSGINTGDTLVDSVISMVEGKTIHEHLIRDIVTKVLGNVKMDKHLA